MPQRSASQIIFSITLFSVTSLKFVGVALSQHHDPDPKTQFVETERKSSGKWLYVLARNAQNTPDEDLDGTLYFDGRIVAPENIHSCIESPWGNMRFHVSAENVRDRKTLHGWIVAEEGKIPWSNPVTEISANRYSCKFQKKPGGQ